MKKINNNKDKIIRYLSENMTEDERNNFLLELNSSPDLKVKFEEIKIKLINFTTDGMCDVESDYWTEIPNNLSKFTTKPKSNLYLKLVYSLPIIILLVFFIALSNNRNSYDTIYDYEISEVVSTFDNQTFEDFYSENLIYDELLGTFINDKIADIYFQNIDVKDLNEINSSSYDYQYLEQMSEEELNNIYESLINEKIL